MIVVVGFHHESICRFPAPTDSPADPDPRDRSDLPDSPECPVNSADPEDRDSRETVETTADPDSPEGLCNKNNKNINNNNNNMIIFQTRRPRTRRRVWCSRRLRPLPASQNRARLLVPCVVCSTVRATFANLANPC